MNRPRKCVLIVVTFLLLVGSVTTALGETYTSTQDFNESSGISWNTIWQQCVPDIPDGAEIDSVTVEIRAKVWAWPSSGRIDLLASNSSTFATDSSYQVCSFTPSTNPSPSNFYTRTCTLKSNQIEWLADNKCIYLEMLAVFGGTYYLDYSKVMAQTTTAKVANPTFAPTPGLYSSPQQVSLSCATEGASIRYTTDGNDPTESSTLYTGPLQVTQTTTFKARAFKTGMLQSDVVTGPYTIESGNESALYLRDKGILSEDMGSPVPWVTNYVYPQDGARILQWQGRLGGDISGNYLFNIDIVESQAVGTLRFELIVDQGGAPTIVASQDVNVPVLAPQNYFPISINLPGMDLQTQDGDLLALRITHVSGTSRIGIGLDGVDAWCDSHVKVFYSGPVPCYAVSPQKGDLNTHFSFDASCSWDSGYPPSDLEVRWDWENDGTYDTVFSIEKTAVQQFSSSGVKYVKLQVRNPDGLLRTKTQRVVLDMVILSSLDAPGPAPAGLAWDGSHLWLSDVNTDTIYRLTTSGEVVTSFPSPCGDPMDLAWDGQHLWVIDAWGDDGAGNVIYKVDTAGNEVTSFSVPADISTGLTWDGHFLWGSDSTNRRIAKIDPATGAVLASFASPGPSPRGMAWDGQTLWVSDYSTHEIHQVNTNGTLLNTFPAPGTGPMGLTWDGENLWCVDLDSYKIYRVTDKIPSAITCRLSEVDVILGERITVTGEISPPPGEAGIGISIELSPPAGDTIYRATLANVNGQFEYPLQCGDITLAGEWTVRTSWAGKGPYVGAASEPVTLKVGSATARLTVNSTSQAIKFGETIDISGKFTPQPDCGRDLSGILLEVHISKPDGSVSVLPVTTMDAYGHYVVQDYAGMNELGDWKIEVKFAGDGGYVATASAAVQVKVVETAGYGIVVQGKIENEEGLKSHQKTANFVYQQLKARGLLDEDIKHFTYDRDAPGFDALPSRGGVEEAVTQWARDKMNGKPANLYLVMVDHGLNEVFYVDPETITSTELAGWLDTLQGGLSGQAAEQEIIVILGFCRSGSFIDDLSGAHRVIIASATANESSYKGPLDADGVRDGEYFVSEFFKSAALGKSVRESFEEAARLVERFTSAGTGKSNAPYFDDSRQHPLLDDNGDDVGSNDLSDPEGDGFFSKDLFVGVSSVTGNDPEDVTVTRVSPTIFLGEGENATDLWAKVDDSTRLGTMWIEIKAPGTAPIDPGGSGQAEMNLPRFVYQSYNPGLDRYEWTNQSGFADPGTYQVFYFAKDDRTGNVSPLKEGRVYKAKAGNRAPLPVSLVSPGDAEEVLTMQLLDWEPATDPDGDRLTYTVFLSKEDPDFAGPIIKEGLIESGCVVTPADGIEDLATYYWKVRTVDPYGAWQESAVRSFRTNNTNPAYPGWISGKVYNSVSGQLVQSATVQVGESTSLSVMQDGHYIGQLPAGPYRVTASADGYRAKTYEDVVIPVSASVTKDFGLIPEGQKGDFNGDGDVDLEDAILALQLTTGLEPSGSVSMEEDVNGDGKVGLQDAIYILQELAGLR